MKNRDHTLLLATGRILVDFSCVALAYLAATWLTLDDESFTAMLRARLNLFVFFLLVWLAAAMDARLFVSRRSEALVALLFTVAKTFFGAWMFTAFLLVIVYRSGVPRGFFVVFGISMLLMLLLFRIILRVSLWSLRRQGYNIRCILLVGANARTAHVVEVFLANEHFGYQIIGFLEDDESRRPILENMGIPCLGGIQDLEHILVERVIDGVYISLPVRSSYESIQSIAHLCEGVGVPVRFLADLFPLRLATSDLTRIQDIPLLSLSVEETYQTQFALRRFFDIITASLLLVLLAPVLVLVAVAIKIESGGPVLVHSRKHGHGGAEAVVLQFRTQTGDEDTGAQLTRVGAFLKRYGLNELPQLVSIVLGQISITGNVYPRVSGRKGGSPA